MARAAAGRPDTAERAGNPLPAGPPDPSGPVQARRTDPGERLPTGAGEQMPRIRVTRTRLVASVLFVFCTVAFLYFVLPKLLDLQANLSRLQQGNFWWLVVALVFEVLSFACYVALFHAVFGLGYARIRWHVSYQITLAGLAATRLLSTAGAGGIALTAWALRRAGMDGRTVATRLVAFLALLYSVYMVALVLGGVGLYLGVWPGSAPFAITILPALFGATAISVFLLASLLPGDFDRVVVRWTRGGTTIATPAKRLAAVPATAAGGVRTAIALLRRRDPALLCAVGAWGFDIGTLWACFHAFGASPPKGVIVMAYFVGWIANALPLPGGVGGVEGGMIGAFVAFGLPVQEAVVAVLAYRAFSFWLPMVPGAIAYLQLRRNVSRWRDSDDTTYLATQGAPGYTF